MKKQVTLSILLLLLFTGHSYSQLSGYYTVGGSQADFPNISNAIATLESQGINGPVTLGLNQGVHNSFELGPIPGASAENRLTIESYNLDSTDITVNGKINLYESQFLTLNAITIEVPNSQSIVCTKPIDCRISNCIVNSNYDNSSSEGAIVIQHGYSGNQPTKISITNCNINTYITGIYTSINEGETLIKNCSIISETNLAIKGRSLNIFNLEKNYLVGGMDISSASNCYLNMNSVFGLINISFISEVVGNHLESIEPIRIRADYFEGNEIISPALIIDSENSYFYNNIIDAELSISHADNSVIKGNHLLKGFRLSFNKVLRLENNYIYGDCSYGNTYLYNYQYYIHNNIFSNCRLHSTGHNSTISYNTFIDSAYLYAYYEDIKIHDNIFCTPADGYYINNNTSNNNYFPTGYAPSDTKPYSYNPQYSDFQYGITTNPLLQGKGLSEAPEYDILGRKRKTPAAIGANEIYICSDSSNAIINAPCGDRVYINTCSVPDTGFFWWSPLDCIEDPDSLYTAIDVCGDMTIYLNSSVYGIIDSVKIISENFEVKIPELPIFYCDYPRTLTATYHPNAYYHWSPEYGLSNPNIRNPILNIEDTDHLEYVVECEVESCGTSSDTLHVEFDSIPYPQLYYPEQVEETIFFNCISRCTDEYLWDFGDGSTSTEKEPSHIFPENGTYTITITVFNEYGQRGDSFDYHYYWLGLQKRTALSEKIKIFPNPANYFISIKDLNQETVINILNMSGKILYSETYNEEHISINTETFEDGVYIIQISSNDLDISKKIIIQH